MVIPNGYVEIWGPMNDGLEIPLSEEDAFKRLSSDKYVLLLQIFSQRMVIEIILVSYAVRTTLTEVHHMGVVEETVSPVYLNETV